MQGVRAALTAAGIRRRGRAAAPFRYARAKPDESPGTTSPDSYAIRPPPHGRGDRAGPECRRRGCLRRLGVAAQAKERLRLICDLRTQVELDDPGEPLGDHLHLVVTQLAPRPGENGRAVD